MDLGPTAYEIFQVGDHVFSLAYGGGYADKISVSKKMLMHIYSNVGFEEAAGTPETFFTALQAVDLLGGFQPGKTVLIHAGASGVGQSAIQVAKALGTAKVSTTAGPDEKCERCRASCTSFAIIYRTSDLAPIVEIETRGVGVGLVADMFGRKYLSRNMQIAAIHSRIVVVAMMSGVEIDNLNLRQLMNKRICLMTTTLQTRDAEYQMTLKNKIFERTMPHLASGSVKTVVDEVYDWKDVSEA